jgi:hypothetical protein
VRDGRVVAGVGKSFESCHVQELGIAELAFPRWGISRDCDYIHVVCLVHPLHFMSSAICMHVCELHGRLTQALAHVIVLAPPLAPIEPRRVRATADRAR